MWPNCKVQSNEESLIPYSPKVEFSAREETVVCSSLAERPQVSK
jgi:hypothetical protein